MNKIIFCDINKELLEKVKKLFKDCRNNTHCQLITSDKDVLQTKKEYKDALIVTASNPNFTMGGGLDKVIKDNYPEQCNSPREFLFTEDLFFTISCDENIQSNKEIIKRALLGCYFASRKNDIILTGIGTSIAGLSEDEFLDELGLFVSADFSHTDFRNANFSNADFSDADFRNADFSDADFNLVSKKSIPLMD